MLWFLLATGSRLDLGPRFWESSLEDAGIPLTAPGRQQRRIQAFATEQSTDTAGAFGLVGRGQNALLVFGGEAPALGLCHDFGIGARAARGRFCRRWHSGHPRYARAPSVPPTAKPLGEEAETLLLFIMLEIFLALHCN